MGDGLLLRMRIGRLGSHAASHVAQTRHSGVPEGAEVAQAPAPGSRSTHLWGIATHSITSTPPTAAGIQHHTCSMLLSVLLLQVLGARGAVVSAEKPRTEWECAWETSWLGLRAGEAGRPAPLHSDPGHVHLACSRRHSRPRASTTPRARRPRDRACGARPCSRSARASAA